MHLGIIAGFSIYCVKASDRKVEGHFGSPSRFFFFPVYAGASPSLQRAYLFLLIAGCVWNFAGVPDPLHVLSFIFVIHLFISPGSCTSLSFKLSYAALSGIFLFGKAAGRILPVVIPLRVRSVISVSFAAQAATLPLTVYYFGVVYTAGIVSSIVLVPAVSLFVCTGLLYLISPAPLSGVLSFFMKSLSFVLKKSTDFFSSFPSYRILREKYPVVLAGVVIMLTLIFLVEYLICITKRSSRG